MLIITKLSRQKIVKLPRFFTDIANLETLHQTLETQGLPIKEAELRWIPNNTIEVRDPDKARSLIKLIDTLESLDDVQNVTSNCDLSHVQF